MSLIPFRQLDQRSGEVEHRPVIIAQIEGAYPLLQRRARRTDTERSNLDPDALDPLLYVRDLRCLGIDPQEPAELRKGRLLFATALEQSPERITDRR